MTSRKLAAFLAWVAPLLLGLWTTSASANWISFTGGLTAAIGVWPLGSGVSGTATVTASNFVNGNATTPPIGLASQAIGPPLSSDFFAAGLQPNADGTVPIIGTQYNDAGDRYHVSIDFSGTLGGAVPGVLPAGTLFAIVDFDIDEDYLDVRATDALGAPITTPWIAGPNGYFDATVPMTPQSSFPANPTLVGPVAGVYDMFGVSFNFDVGMWLFATTQDVRAIEFDMDKGLAGNAIGAGGAGWAFYSPAVSMPEPGSLLLLAGGLLGFAAFRRRYRGAAALAVLGMLSAAGGANAGFIGETVRVEAYFPQNVLERDRPLEGGFLWA